MLVGHLGQLFHRELRQRLAFHDHARQSDRLEMGCADVAGSHSHRPLVLLTRSFPILFRAIFDEMESIRSEVRTAAFGP